MDLIKKLSKLKKQLITKEVFKYQKTVFATVFTEENLSSLADDIIMKMKLKQEKGELDERGVYNFFRQSFKWRCIDEIKKYNCQKRKNFLANSNIDDCSFFIEDNKESHNPYSIQNSIDILKLAFNELREHQKKKPLSEILNMIVQGYNSKEIQDKLSISSSSLDRYKKEMIKILEPLDLKEELIFSPSYKVNEIREEDKTKEKITTYKMIKFNDEKSTAHLYINNNGHNLKIKTWKFNHNDLDIINETIDAFDITPHLIKEKERSQNVSK